MKKNKMLLTVSLIGFIGLGIASWTFAARAAYESAEYTVKERDGLIEVREYPDLMLVATETKLDSQGRDGSFMRLFRYISGANEEEKKIAMTTPVFMEGEIGKADRSMGFVMPRAVADRGIPKPTSENLQIRKRVGGLFAAIRFAGRLDAEASTKHENILRSWLKEHGYQGADTSEAAGYDPPFVPGPLRRNEVLIRLLPPPASSTETR